MIKFLFKHKWFIVFILILSFVSSALNSWMNFYLQRIFNYANLGASKILLIRMLSIGFLVWISKRFVEYSSSLLRSRFLCNVKRDLKRDMFGRLLGIDVSKFEKQAAGGDYISSFTNDITILEERYFSNIIGLISNIISVVVLGSSFLALDSILATFILIFAVITVFIPTLFARLLSSMNLKYSNKIAYFTQKLKEYVAAYQMIKNYSVESQIRSKFDEINDDTENARYNVELVLALANNVGSMLSWFMQFIAMGIGLIMMVNGEITIGTIIAARSFASDLALPLQTILINVNSICSVKDISKKFRDYVLTEKREKRDTEPFDTSSVEVSFDNVNLQIGNHKIISDFSFTFEAGKKYLIIGKNGSGKSTIFRILKRFQSGATGDIRINKTELAKFDDASLSRYISYLNGNVTMLSASVKDNILIYRDDLENKLDKATVAARVGLDLDREIGDGGKNISSGERRRIEIARSLISSTPFIIFDEVVSTLDIETAYEIENMVINYDKTIVFISHNFSGKLMKLYDEILILDSGRLAAHGSFDHLIENCEYFRSICEIKFGDMFRE